MKLLLTCLRGHRRACDVVSESRENLDAFVKIINEAETRCERTIDVFESRRLDGICGAAFKARVIDDGD